MNILVTGGAGFIGSNFVHFMLKKYPNDKIINLDLLTYAGNINNLEEVMEHPNHTFVQGNINNEELVRHLIDEHNITHIINFAAESHVDRSIKNPKVFIETNVLGTTNLLNIAKDVEIEKFVQISTDEIYGSLGETGYFTEETPFDPNSPYSSSKASADLIALSYFETFGMNISITSCSNNYGPYQFPEKLIPLMVTNAMDGKKLPIYGDGLNVRDWLHVEDHCQAIDLVLREGQAGEIYNIGGHNERTNNEIVHLIVDYLDAPEELITYVEDRLGHDKRYAIDPTKIETELGWKPKYTFDTGIIETIEWYKANENWWRPLKERAKL